MQISLGEATHLFSPKAWTVDIIFTVKMQGEVKESQETRTKEKRKNNTKEERYQSSNISKYVWEQSDKVCQLKTTMTSFQTKKGHE